MIHSDVLNTCVISQKIADRLFKYLFEKMQIIRSVKHFPGAKLCPLLFRQVNLRPISKWCPSYILTVSGKLIFSATHVPLSGCLPEMYTGIFAITRFATARDHCVSRQFRNSFRVTEKCVTFVGPYQIFLLTQLNQRKILHLVGGGHIRGCNRIAKSPTMTANT